MVNRFGSVRSLERGLGVLQALNGYGGLSPAEVAAVVGIPRSTAYRLLETLEGLGFVACGPSDRRWRPTLRAKSLSSGFRDEDWVAQIAVPRIMRLGKQVLWPIDLVTFHDYAMVVRETTHNISPYSVDRGMVGRRLPMAETSAGRAYLAFLPDEEREHILARLRDEQGTGAIDHQIDGALSEILERTRELGVGFRSRGYNAQTQSISAPVHGPDRLVGCLSLIWIASAMRVEDALREHRDQLIACANAIRDDMLHQLRDGPEPSPAPRKSAPQATEG